MEKISKTSKIAAIVILTAIITVMHYNPVDAEGGVHIIHRELFTIPILLAALWFGLKFALATSAAVSLLYAPQMIVAGGINTGGAAIFSQIIFFNLVALLVGWMMERQKKQGEKLAHAEKLSLLGRAASAMAHEIKDIVHAIKRLTKDADNFACTEFDMNFYGELQRLDRLVDNLTSYVPGEEICALSGDLNHLIRKKIEEHRGKAEAAGIALESRLDDAGCPSMLDPEKIGWVLDILISNAMEFSAAGKKILVQSVRKGSHCEVQVRDQGPGIKPQHIGKIFEPFFTTKKGGTGLSLASCKKILRDMGGGITVSSPSGEGAVFTLFVPREKKDKPYREKVLAAEKAMAGESK